MQMWVVLSKEILKVNRLDKSICYYQMPVGTTIESNAICITLWSFSRQKDRENVFKDVPVVKKYYNNCLHKITHIETRLIYTCMYIYIYIYIYVYIYIYIYIYIQSTQYRR